ncbi:hypothetical protein [Nonomuraea jiangxiensis]|uniref:Uncharacterized protein n=1 Tax=Nonomuraea jiangxiensis TaxID=633440 RepID=A0A1G8ZEC6_9ACTN|nr:hypothetical protein [Nonomuraea jiangxiensis]SDK13476.1 hypothetical protein SAMN05421869_11448 [Nonomuraea jiangxiensis]
MYRSGLVLAGLVGGMIMVAGPALAATPGVAAVATNANILPGPGHGKDDGVKWDFGEWNNFGEDNDIVDVDILNQLLKSVLSG